MRNLLRILPLLMLGIVAGCTIYSVNPFCTKGKIMDLKEVNGYWKLNISTGEDVSKNDITPWKITDNTVITYDRNDKKSDFNIAFFKIKDQLFADVVDSHLNAVTDEPETHAKPAQFFHQLALIQISRT